MPFLIPFFNFYEIRFMIKNQKNAPPAMNFRENDFTKNIRVKNLKRFCILKDDWRAILSIDANLIFFHTGSRSLEMIIVLEFWQQLAFMGSFFFLFFSTSIT